MSNELTSQEKVELTGGGPCTSHYHETIVTHNLLERLQDQYRVVTVTTTYTASMLDDIIICDTTGGSFVVTLPATNTQKEFTIARSVNDALYVDITFSNGMTFYGYTTFRLTYFGIPVRFKVHNGNWILV